MNSEELEQSLRTEFENYLKETISELKQEVSGFQEKIESAFENHKSQVDKAFQAFYENFGDEKSLENSFGETVSEHLKLARDEGSKITAAAFEEAEKLREREVAANAEPTAVAESSSAQFADIRDAINEISIQDSQSEILRSLVHHATQYTPRGAFFIVKNEHLVGWRIFGTEEHSNPEIVREIFFPLASKTALSESAETLATIEGGADNGEDDLLYLNKLGFENPEKMYAIPLIARGRGVAVLYADNGTEDGSVNVEALETLMRVAGLTVEVLASTQMTKNKYSEQPAYAGVQVREDEEQFSHDYAQPDFEDTEDSEEAEFEQADFSTDEYAAIEEESEYVSEVDGSEEDSTGFEFQPAEEEAGEEAEESKEYAFADVSEETDSGEAEEEISYQDSDWDSASEEAEQDFSSVEEEREEDYSASYSYDSYSDEDAVSTGDDYQTGVSDSYDQPSAFESTQFESFSDTAVATEEPEEASEETEQEYSYQATDTSYEVETSSEESAETTATDESEYSYDASQEDDTEESEAVEESFAAPPVRTRFADRNVDLPIEVTEDERRLHNDARRFARLLVSEIKLYNEQKVKEGRESSDLYERLREAIDRSREMYDKRVQPPVAAKFDYFNYELVNTLAEGDEGKLGTSYPGAVV